MDRSIISTLLKLLQTERNYISKNQKGQKSNCDSYLSLLVLIRCSHALKPLLLPPAKTDTGRAACMCSAPHVAHITVSEMVHDSPPGFSPSFHTTSGAVGPAPGSGGGLCRCTLQHISERTLHMTKTDCVGRSASERPPCSSCINICPQLGRMQEGSFSFWRVGALLCVSVHGEEWVHSCLKTMMHCSMERVCSCGHILVREHL